MVVWRFTVLDVSVGVLLFNRDIALSLGNDLLHAPFCMVRLVV